MLQQLSDFSSNSGNAQIEKFLFCFDVFSNHPPHKLYITIPDICPFWYATILFGLQKVRQKSAQLAGHCKTWEASTPSKGSAGGAWATPQVQEDLWKEDIMIPDEHQFFHLP